MKPTKKDLIRWSSELTALRNGADTDTVATDTAGDATGATDAADAADAADAFESEQGTANPMLQI